LEIISSCLANTSLLYTLTICGIGATYEGIKLLADSLRKNTSLCSLLLNEIDEDGLKYLFSSLVSNSSLKQIVCGKDDIEPDVIERLIPIIQENHSLILIKFGRSDITHPEIEKIISRNKKITDNH
jgi:hypothetical protein